MWEAGFEPFMSLVLVDPGTLIEARSGFLHSVWQEGRLLYAQSSDLPPGCSPPPINISSRSISKLSTPS